MLEFNYFISKNFVYKPFYMLTGKNINELIRYFNHSQWEDEKTLLEKHLNKTKKIISYAYENIPYYQKAFKKEGLHPDDIKTRQDFLNIPVLTKEDIKKNFNELYPASYKGKKFTRRTSGSTGSPLKVVKDTYAVSVMDAVMHRNYSWFDIKMGQRQAFFWGKPLDRISGLKQNIKDTLLNRLRFSPFDISPQACDKYIAHLRIKRPKFAYGYAQTIFRFSSYVNENDIDLSDLNLSAVIVTGEMIAIKELESIEKAFKCPVANEYGCTEVGVVAMRCPHKEMHLMTDNLFLEFINNGRHVNCDEEGEIIITELYGNLMPLIRYQIGDIVVPSSRKCRCGRSLPLMDRVIGRKDEFIVTPSGKQIDPIVFEYILKDIPKRYGSVSQFRITQQKDYNLSIEIVCGENKTEALIPRIIEKMENAVGDGCSVAIIKKNEIAAERTGKMRCFISEIKKQT